MCVSPLVTVGIVAVWRDTQAGDASDDRLERVPARPDERLVVEAGRKQGMEHIVQSADVEAQRRPAVLTARLKTFDEGA